MSAISALSKYSRRKVVSVQVSTVSHRKAVQLERFMAFSSAKRLWNKDQRLIRYNILAVPNAANYKVLLAMGRQSKKPA